MNERRLSSTQMQSPEVVSNTMLQAAPYPPTHNRQPIYYGLPIINTAVPEKDARRVLDWQAEVARQTASIQDSGASIPPPLIAPPPLHHEHSRNVGPLGSPPSPQGYPIYRRAETVPRTPGPMAETASTFLDTPYRNGATLGLSDMTPRPRRGSLIDRDWAQAYRARRRSRGRRDRSEVDVEIRPAMTARSRSTVGDFDRDSSRNGRERTTKSSAHYVVPTAATTGAAHAHGTITYGKRSNDAFAYPLPLTPAYRNSRANEDWARERERDRRPRSRSEVGRIAPSQPPYRAPMHKPQPGGSLELRYYARSSSCDRCSSQSPSTPIHQQRHSSPVNVAMRIPPPQPASYASHASSGGPRGGVTFKRPGVGVEYVISSDTGPPGTTIGRGSGIGVTKIRVIPRKTQDIDVEYGSRRGMEKGLKRGLAMERERRDVHPPSMVNGHRSVLQDREELLKGGADDHATRYMTTGLAGGGGRWMNTFGRGMGQMVVPPSPLPPAPPPPVAPTPPIAGYAKTIIPSDSTSSLGERRYDPDRLRDRMVLDRRR